MEGWIKLHRKLIDNRLWLSEPFTRGQAWVDMLLLANHQDSFFRIRGVRVDVKRGQIGYSIPKLAERWKWSKGKVKRFLGELETDSQIDPQKNNVTSVITIVNYNTMQGCDTPNGSANGVADGVANGSQTDLNKNVKNVKNEKKESENEYLSPSRKPIKEPEPKPEPRVVGEYLESQRLYVSIWKTESTGVPNLGVFKNSLKRVEISPSKAVYSLKWYIENPSEQSKYNLMRTAFVGEKLQEIYSAANKTPQMQGPVPFKQNYAKMDDDDMTEEEQHKMFCELVPNFEELLAGKKPKPVEPKPKGEGLDSRGYRIAPPKSMGDYQREESERDLKEISLEVAEKLKEMKK